MPVIHIEYDKAQFDDALVRELMNHFAFSASEAIKRPLDEVSIFASPYHMTLNAMPMEVYLQIGTSSLPPEGKEQLLAALTSSYASFKKSRGLQTPINISVVEMNWRFSLNQ